MNVMMEPRRPASIPTLVLSAFDALPDGVLVFDGEDHLSYWNAPLLEILPQWDDWLKEGLSLDAVLGQLAICSDSRIVHRWKRNNDKVAVVTVRRATEDPVDGQLRESEKRWRDVAHSFADWVWETDADGALTYLSPGFIRAGVPCCAVSAKANCLYYLPGELGEWKRQIPALYNREPFQDVRISLNVGQSVDWYSVSGVPVFDDHGFRGFRGTGRNVTAQVQAEQEHEKARARLRDAIEYLSHGLAVFDPDDRLVLCNERFRQLLPRQSEVLVPGTHFVDVARRVAQVWLSDPSDVEHWVAERAECFHLGLTHERRYPDGRWFLVKDMRLNDGSTVVTRTDITELKRREQAVRDSEARFRTIFQHAAIGVAVIQPGGRIAQANQALAAMLGYSPTELAQMRYSDLVHPQDLKAEVQLARQLVAGEIDHYQLETRYLRKDKGAFWARLTVSIVRGDGVERFCIAMIEDIDKRKRAEADLSTFRSIVEASDEAIAIFSQDGHPFYVNSAYEKLFGRRLTDGVDRGYRQHYTEESQELLRREVIPGLRRGGNWEGVVDARAADGRVFPVWQRAGVVRGANGRPQYYFVFMHDHTPQQEIQDELFRAKEAAEQANTAKTRFLAAASHDLRQPLQALSMFVAVLSNRPHPPEDATLIKRIEDSVIAVETLLNGLLDVSKLEAGLVVPASTTFNIGPLLERLGQEFEPLVAEAGLAMRLAPVHAVVKSDPALLERILRNLLNNAVRYTNKGRILLGCRRRGRVLRIEVWDTGIGIHQSQLKLIFREFHQLGNPGRDRRQGLGLGLSIVERLAELLDHRIHVSSVPEKGSVFAVEVPLAANPENASQPKQLTLGITRRDAAVMVIEDEPDVLESTRLLLESWGYKVYAAPDCNTALRQLPQCHKAPDLILADYRLQNGATGGQAISRIRARLKKAVPAIVLTGDTAPERLKQAQASGHALLHKPVQPAALRQMIDELLAQAPEML